MLYLKALHLLFIISWMAGIFYLPRIFVHYVEGRAAGEDVRRLRVMGRKLYHFTSVMAVLAIVTGTTLWWVFWQGTGWWIDAKLGMVGLLIAYHITMRVYVKRMQADGVMPSSLMLRLYNELPLLILLPILYFVVFKPV
jgi:protoporphyrinogen IX oxidase